ncbi:MAG: hypothetical protein Q4G61_01515 [Tissierellia bacterium]|nr:hypothetical protein [Tissierellia bacterium]
MKKHRATRAFAAFLLAVSIILSACGGTGQVAKPTDAADLITKSQEAISKAKSSEADLNISMGLGEIGSMEMKGIIEDIKDPLQLHFLFDAKLSGLLAMAGDSMQIESFAEPDPSNSENIITYTRTQMGEEVEWEKSSQSKAEGNMASSAESLSKMAEDVKDSLTLAEATEKIDGKELYVVTGTVKGSALEGTVAESFDVTGGMAEEAEFDFTAKYDAKTLLPHSIDMVMKPIDASSTEEVPEGLEMFGDVEITMNMNVLFKGFDTVKSIEIPQEAKDAPESTTE